MAATKSKYGGGNKMIIHKDKSGQQWFVGIYSNNFEDRQGHMLSWKGHLEYAQWIKDMGIKLPVTILHQPKFPIEVHLAQFMGLVCDIFTPQEFSDNYMKLYKPFAFAQTEAIIPINGFMLVVAKVLKGKEKTVQLLSKSSWGMSHGYLVLDRDDTTTNQYRSFEFTALPPSLAANTITASSIKEIFEMDVLKSLSDEDRATLEEMLKSDPAELEESLGTMQEILSKVLDSKEITEDDQEEETEGDLSYEGFREKIFTDLGVESLQKAFNQIVEMLDALDHRFEGIESRVKQTERSEDDKIADTFDKPNWVWEIKSEEEDLTEEERKELKEKALGDKPLPGVDNKATDDDPLTFTWKTMVQGGQQ